MSETDTDGALRMVSFKLEPDAHTALEQLAKRQDRSVSYLLRLAVRDYLATQEAATT